ncbi:hypothetical protein BC829DRAFT_154881 [Chytridium lagenaria]|nr:hypothetical protein BC829DRAFT_154881 [Chytridium lagenaria]
MHKIEEYSNDLVTGDHARKPHHHHQNAPSPTPPPIQHQQTYSQPTRSEYNPVPATFNPISHAPNPSKPIEARRRKFQIDDERESVYPLGIKVPDQPIQRPPPEPDMFNRFNTEYRAPEKSS